jgi:hypothetical protein
VPSNREAFGSRGQSQASLVGYITYLQYGDYVPNFGLSTFISGPEGTVSQARPIRPCYFSDAGLGKINAQCPACGHPPNRHDILWECMPMKKWKPKPWKGRLRGNNSVTCSTVWGQGLGDSCRKIKLKLRYTRMTPCSTHTRHRKKRKRKSDEGSMAVKTIGIRSYGIVPHKRQRSISPSHVKPREEESSSGPVMADISVLPKKEQI